MLSSFFPFFSFLRGARLTPLTRGWWRGRMERGSQRSVNWNDLNFNVMIFKNLQIKWCWSRANGEITTEEFLPVNLFCSNVKKSHSELDLTSLKRRRDWGNILSSSDSEMRDAAPRSRDFPDWAYLECSVCAGVWRSLHGDQRPIGT